MCDEVEDNAAHLRPELCPSIRELIHELHTHQKLLGVASGNLERIGWAKLRACGLRHYFSFGTFSDRNEKRDDIFAYGIQQASERLTPAAKVYVAGDTPADIASAKANGVPVIALATGIYETHELMAYAPEMCVPCGADLLAYSSSTS